MTENFAELIRTVAGGQQQNREELLKALLYQDILVPIEGQPQANKAGGDTSIVKVLCAYDHQGYLAVGLFASEESLLRWLPGGCRFVKTNGRNIFKMLVAMPVQRAYLEWGSDLSVMISLEEIDLLASGKTSQLTGVYELPAIEEIKFSSPRSPISQEIRQELTSLVKSDERIAFAYMPQVEYLHRRSTPPQARQSPKPIITLVLVPQPDLPENDIEEAINHIGLQARFLLPLGQPMDVITLPGNHEMLSLVMRTDSVLAVNNENYHRKVWDMFSRMWEISA